MSQEVRRQARLLTLTNWFKRQLVNDDFFKWRDHHIDVVVRIEQEAMKRWGVSYPTARNYAKIIFYRFNPEINAKLKNLKEIHRREQQ